MTAFILYSMDIFPQLIANSIVAGALYSLVALGFNLVYGTVKFFDLSYGAIAMVGAYATLFFSQTLGWSVFESVASGIIFSGMMHFLVNRVVYVPLRKRKATNMVFLVASLGIFTLLQSVIAMIFTNRFHSLSTGSANTYQIFGGIITDVQIFLVLATFLSTFGMFVILKKTMFGKMIQAVGDDTDVAKIVGIDTEKIIGCVFFIGGCVAGLVGILASFDTGIEPSRGMALLLKGVIAAIMGGIGNIGGGMLGGFLLGFVENFGIWKISAEWKDAIAFGLLILFLLFRPEGIVGKKQWK